MARTFLVKAPTVELLGRLERDARKWKQDAVGQWVSADPVEDCVRELLAPVDAGTSERAV